MKKFLIICLFLCFAGSAFAASGIRYAPFDGAWAPAGTKFAVLYANHYAANEFYTNGVKSKDRMVTQNIGILRLGGYIGLPADMMFQPSLVLPFGDASLDVNTGPGSTKHFTSTGLTDPELNLILRPVQWKANTYFNGYLNVGLVVQAPLGTYNSESPVNLGTNRWTFRPMLGLGQNFGPFHFDLHSGYDIFTDNDDYTNAAMGIKDETMVQYPEYWAEGHLSYFIVPENRTYASISFGGLWGGRKEVDNHRVQDWMESYAIKFTIGTTITKHFSMYAYYQQDTAVANGPKGYQTGIRLGIAQAPIVPQPGQ